MNKTEVKIFLIRIFWPVRCASAQGTNCSFLENYSRQLKDLIAIEDKLYSTFCRVLFPKYKKSSLPILK